MATVAALFGSQAEAGGAIDALVDTPFADVETRVFESGPAGRGAPGVVPVPNVGAGTMTGAIVPGFSEWLDDIDDEVMQDFFLEGVRHGGVLLLADVDDEDVAEMEAFLREHGGRTTAEG